MRESREKEMIDGDRRKPRSDIERTKEQNTFIQTCKKPASVTHGPSNCSVLVTNIDQF